MLQRKYLVLISSIFSVDGMLTGTCVFHDLNLQKQIINIILTLTTLNRAWKNHLRSVKKENQIDLYQTLCILESETNVDLFDTQIKLFTESWCKQEPEFIKYFSENYLNRPGLQ